MGNEAYLMPLSLGAEKVVRCCAWNAIPPRSCDIYLNFCFGSCQLGWTWVPCPAWGRRGAKWRRPSLTSWRCAVFVRGTSTRWRRRPNTFVLQRCILSRVSAAPDGSFRKLLQLQDGAARRHPALRHCQQQQGEGEGVRPLASLAPKVTNVNAAHRIFENLKKYCRDDPKWSGNKSYVIKPKLI